MATAYAILRSGNKQYRVKPGDLIDVEKLPVEVGSAVELTDVLAVSRDGDMRLGRPLVEGASILADVLAQDRDDKIIVFKYKRKVRYRRKKGHRQAVTRLAITSIVVDGEEIGIPQPPEKMVPAMEEPAAEQAVEEPMAEAQVPVEAAEEEQELTGAEPLEEGLTEAQPEAAAEPVAEMVEQPALEEAPAEPSAEEAAGKSRRKSVRKTVRKPRAKKPKPGGET